MKLNDINKYFFYDKIGLNVHNDDRYRRYKRIPFTAVQINSTINHIL